MMMMMYTVLARPADCRMNRIPTAVAASSTC